MNRETPRYFENFWFLGNKEILERVTLNTCFDFNMAFVPFAEEGFDFGSSETDFDEYLSKHGPVIGSDYVGPAKAILTPEIKKCVEEIRETKLFVECDEKFTERRLVQMNMIKKCSERENLGL